MLPHSRPSLGLMGQTYPTRPVRLIAPFPPGGSIDIAARLIGQWLSERLGQQFVIENRSGAGRYIGSETANIFRPPTVIRSYYAVWRTQSAPRFTRS